MSGHGFLLLCRYTSQYKNHTTVHRDFAQLTVASHVMLVLSVCGCRTLSSPCQTGCIHTLVGVTSKVSLSWTFFVASAFADDKAGMWQAHGLRPLYPADHGNGAVVLSFPSSRFHPSNQSKCAATVACQCTVDLRHVPDVDF